MARVARRGYDALMNRIDPATRCPWCLGSEAYIAYHDAEWGVPVHDERLLFELLILEGAQAGLSWSTILNKRDGYRKAFDDFDARKIARYTEGKVARLLADPGIVRNRLKVAAAIHNAGVILRLSESHGSFAGWLNAHHPRDKAAWVTLFGKTFRFTGGEIVGEFLMSIGYLPGAHRADCPVHARIVAAAPAWMGVP